MHVCSYYNTYYIAIEEELHIKEALYMWVDAYTHLYMRALLVLIDGT